MRRLIMVFAAAGSLALAPQEPQRSAAPQAPEAALNQLMALASGWTSRFEQSLSGMLFRERYLQRSMVAHTERQGESMSELIRIPENTTRNIPREVLTESTMFMVKLPGARDFIFYRDVYRVGTEDIGDHTERLQKLLLAGTSETFQQARALTNASARFNLAGVRRNVHVPTMTFEYLAPAVLAGLRVRAVARDRLNDMDTIVIEFQEAARPTRARGPNGQDIPASGKYWIHAQSGAVMRAQVVLDAKTSKGRVDVKLELNKELGAWVPREMSEVWETGAQSVTGLAQYDRFQRLNVSTAEIIK